MSQFKTISLEIRDKVATITLARPPLNIINLEMMQELEKALDELSAKHELNTLVIRSGIEGIFSAGADVREHLPEKADELIASFENLVKKLIAFPRPTVCVVDGKCLGGGMELALACDLVVATREAELGQPEIRVGVYPPIASALYPRIVGLKHAAMIILSGNTVKAEEAYRIGLVNMVVEKGELDKAVDELVKTLSGNSGVVMQYAKMAMLASLNNPLEHALRRSSEIYLNQLMQTEDSVEGLKAFLEKRKPVWKNK